jgi:hypothetical protein
VLLKEDASVNNEAAHKEKVEQLEKRLNNSRRTGFMYWGATLYRALGYGWSVVVGLGLMAMPVLSHFDLLPIDFTGIMAILGFMILFGALEAQKS